MSFGNIARDLSATSLSTVRSTAAKLATGYFAGDVRLNGALVQYQRSPGLWVTVEEVRVPTTQLGNKLVMGNAPNSSTIDIDTSGSGKVIAAAYDQLGGTSVLTILTADIGNVYAQTPLLPTGIVGPPIGCSCSLSDDGALCALGIVSNTAVWIFAATPTWTQQGTTIEPVNGLGPTNFGTDVVLSNSGQLLAVSGPSDNSVGAVWLFSLAVPAAPVFITKIVNPGSGAGFGTLIDLSGDGSTLAVSCSNDGLIYIFTATNGVWALQQTLTPEVGPNDYNFSLSNDGDTLIVGILSTSVYPWYRVDGVWTPGPLLPLPVDLVGLGDYGNPSLSDDGRTVLVSSPINNGNAGACWVYTRNSDGTWTENGPALVGTGGVGTVGLGLEISLSGDGKRAVASSTTDNSGQGALWVFV